MPSLPSVNQQLWVHAARGRGASEMIRARFSHMRGAGWIPTLATFFDTTDDFSRIVCGRAVSECLLRQRNMDYLVTLRDIVTEMELSRSTQYPKQTDHTVHTLYLFFLGVWMFDHSAHFRKQYSDCCVTGDRSPRWTYDAFLLQWLFAGLMHDVGYVFESVSPATKPYRESVDELFRVDESRILKKHFPYCDAVTIETACSIVSRNIRAWSDAGALPQYAEAMTPKAVVRELDKAPWAKGAVAGMAGSTSSLFQVSEERISARLGFESRPSAAQLMAYGSGAADLGYFGRPPAVVDHAFASGSLLLQLTSLRYWLVRTVAAQQPSAAELLSGRKASDRWPGFSYDYSALIDNIVPACHAVASHNFLPGAMVATSALPFSLEHGPLVFLSVLCDELQQWHRPPVGASLTKAPFSIQPPSEDRIFLQAGAEWPDERPGFGCSDPRLASRVVESVQVKLAEDSLTKMFAFFGEAAEYESNKELLKILGVEA